MNKELKSKLEQLAKERSKDDYLDNYVYYEIKAIGIILDY